MKRRSFLAMLGLAPVAAVSAGAANAPNDYLRELISGTLDIPTANIGSVTGGVLHSADRSLTMDMSAGTLTFFA